MADTSDHTVTLAKDRRQLANVVMWVSFGLLIALSVAIVAAVVIIFVSLNRTSAEDVDRAVGYFQDLLSSILPLIGAWVGAIIAFYFARENFDAATQSTRVLIRELQPGRLETVAAGTAMIPLNKLTMLRMPTDKDVTLPDVIIRFDGYSRMPILNDDDTGVGVLHDGEVKGFLLKWQEAGNPPQNAKVSTIVADPEMKKVLDASVVYVATATTLATVKAEMEKRSKTGPRSCRDAFVTDDGTQAGKVVGYISDIDLTKYGAYGS